MNSVKYELKDKMIKQQKRAKGRFDWNYITELTDKLEMAVIRHH